MAIKSDTLALNSPQPSTAVHKSPSVYTCKGSVKTPQKRVRATRETSEPNRQSTYSSCSTLCADDTRNMTGFERIMAAAGSDTEMKLMSFINEYDDLVPMPGLMACSSEDDAAELVSQISRRDQKVYFSPPPKGFVSQKDQTRAPFKQHGTPKMSSNRSGLCFNKVCPSSAPQKRVSLLSVMLQSSDSEGNESEVTAMPKRPAKSIRKCIEFCLPSKDEVKPSKEILSTLTPVRTTRIPGHRYEGYFDEGVQIW
ncbi:hypothetical protein K493DRAFT_311984 [Basidiobolus meristosporus CBS 931.73]|uniref:Uncharacterized protein n=1 Tax=Basidiobolus meristosporus CBS 931.73 TaxID=1314790 RepID=A0A1Y1YY64_9FUNG|nr:hypothetical protein K493DRAFT_311984 [Basidiobolus meristosporus CBS 931.73]|eukprot:ORY02824.1 hypothetical protein K493DRAFT_311984 [Basidiobolus meristosporus CBS 931.73]